MATASLYRMPPSETCSTRRCRVTSGALAQLVSKFEDLISTTGVEQPTLSHSSSFPYSQSSSNFSDNLKMLPRLDADNIGDEKQLENKICDSNAVSPGHFTGPSIRRPTCIKLSSSDMSEMQDTPNTAYYLCSRHKSVAERRKAFESGDETSSAWTSARTSTDTGSPSKLAHSRSWQTIRTGSSFNRYLEGDSSSDSSSSQPTVTGEESHLVSTTFDYRSLLRRSKNVLSSAVASRNRFKTMPDLAPRIMKKEMSPLSAVSRSSWMKLDNRAGKSLSSLKSSNMSSYTLPLLSDQHQFKENTEGSIAQKPLIARKSKATFGVAQSKIASLRQIFDRPKSTTTSPIASAKTKRRETTPIPMASTPNKPRRLQKSATVQMLGSTDSLKIKSRDPNIDNAITSSRSQIPNSSTISLPQKESPLKEKIGLFESLARESCDGSPRSTRSQKVTQEKPFLQSYKSKISGVKKSFQIKCTLRRLSASWRTSSEDNEVFETKTKTQEVTKPKDAWWMRRDLAVIRKAPRPQLSPRAAEMKSSPTSATNKEQSKAKAAVVKKDSHAFRDTQCISKRWSLNDQGFNVDGEGGARSKGTQFFKHDNSPIPVALSLSKSASYSMGNNDNDRPLSPPTAPMGQKAFGTHSLLRRRTSRSSGPFVANAYCKLEQPKPVRTGEMRRIISLCKDKVTRRVSGGGYE